MSNETKPEFRSRAAQAEEWYTKAGDTTEGFLIDVQEGVGKFKSTIYTLKKTGGSIHKIWGSTVIDNQMQGSTIGRYYRFEYLGMEESQGGSQYKNFEVFEAPNMGTVDSHFGTTTAVSQRTQPQGNVVKASALKPDEPEVADDSADDLPF
jgi:hypothetical protein